MKQLKTLAIIGIMTFHVAANAGALKDHFNKDWAEGELTPYRTYKTPEKNSPSKDVEKYYSDFAFKVEKLSLAEKKSVLKYIKQKRQEAKVSEEFNHYDKLVSIVKKSITGSLKDGVKVIAKGAPKVMAPMSDHDAKVTDLSRGAVKESEAPTNSNSTKRSTVTEK